LFSRSSGLVDQIFLPVADREAGEGQELFGVVAQHGLELGELPSQHAGDHVQLVVDMGGVGLGEDGADGRGDHLG
jgi:hypothetical protein